MSKLAWAAACAKSCARMGCFYWKTVKQKSVTLMGAWNAGPARRIVRQAPSGLLPVWDAPIILFKPGLKEKMRRHVIVWNVADFPIISGH